MLKNNSYESDVLSRQNTYFCAYEIWCKDNFSWRTNESDMNQREKIKFGILILAFFMPLLSFAQKGEKIQTIVIDAGHGGKDPGALGKSCNEKDVNLAVALKFGAYISENMPDVKVVYTRDKDRFVELNERAAIANRNNADLFVSIHCNATEKGKVSGVETFVMGESKNEANLNVAKAENAAILLEDNASENYDNFDPNSTEAYILFSLSQSLYQNQSLQFADKVQQQLVSKGGRADRGVQQAGFLVLWKTPMPSILVELGFIDNAKDEPFLSSEKGQTLCALSLYRAFEEYKQAYDSDNQVAENKPTAPAPTGNNEVVYKVQIATRDIEVPLTDHAFKGVPEVAVYYNNKYYCYTSGNFKTQAEAVARQTEVRKLGFTDAFVIAFVNGERATLKQAEEARKK